MNIIPDRPTTDDHRRHADRSVTRTGITIRNEGGTLPIASLPTPLRLRTSNAGRGRGFCRRVQVFAAVLLAALSVTLFAGSPADAATRVDARLSQTCDSRTNVVTAVLRLENYSWPEPVWGGRIRVSYYDVNHRTWNTGTWTYVSLPAGDVQQFRSNRQLGDSVYRTVVEVQPLTAVYPQITYGPSLAVQVSSNHWWSAGFWAGNTGDLCYMNLQ